MSFCGCVTLRSFDEWNSETEVLLPDYSAISDKKVNGSFASSSEHLTDGASAADEDLSAETAERLEVYDPYLGVNISFLAAGDSLIHPNIYMDAGFRGTAEKVYDFLPMYEDVSDFIASYDISFINQETVMAGEGYEPSGWPMFNSPRELGYDLVTVGFDIINIANNHMLDMGTTGLIRTIEFWSTQPVVLLGGYLDEEDYSNIRIYEEDGVKIALLTYTYETNGNRKSADSTVVVPYIDDELILSDIAKAEEIADLTFVSIHWGDEYSQTPNSEQKRLAQMIAGAGAEVILGHHSHSLQPIEWIENEDGTRTLCAYSLGNLMSGMSYPVNQVGGFLTFNIVSDGMGGLTIDSPEFTPTVFYYGMDWFDTKLYFLTDYTDEIGATHGVGLKGNTLSHADAERLLTNAISEEYLVGYREKTK